MHRCDYCGHQAYHTNVRAGQVCPCCKKGVMCSPGSLGNPTREDV